MITWNVYCITNDVTNGFYIGCTQQTLENRFVRHLQKNNRCSGLKTAMDTIGRPHFKIELLREFDNKKDALLMEADLINRYKPEYNITNPYIYRFEGHSKSHAISSKKHHDKHRDKIMEYKRMRKHETAVYNKNYYGVLLDGEKMMWGKTNMITARKILNGEL